jgi:hypothetical protein
MFSEGQIRGVPGSKMAIFHQKFVYFCSPRANFGLKNPKNALKKSKKISLTFFGQFLTFTPVFLTSKSARKGLLKRKHESEFSFQ